MIPAASLIVEAIVIVVPIRLWLARSRWTADAPRAAIALWQAIVTAAVIAVVGACLIVAAGPGGGTPPHMIWSVVTTLASDQIANAMTPNQLYGLTVGLIVSTILISASVARCLGLHRARIRTCRMLDLVGETRTEAPGALVLEHSSPTAYCLPGFRSRIVVTTGAIDCLSDDELTAVLAHEKAHVHARHDLALLPFRSLSVALPGTTLCRSMITHVQALAEMAADDRAMRRCDRVALAGALVRLSTDPVPAGAFGAVTVATQKRIERALAPRGCGAFAAVGGGLAATAVLGVPIATLASAVWR